MEGSRVGAPVLLGGGAFTSEVRAFEARVSLVLLLQEQLICCCFLLKWLNFN